jgi:hypothetical protein
MLAVAIVVAVIAAVAAAWVLARPKQPAVKYRVEASDAAGLFVSPEVEVVAAAPALMPEVVSTARPDGTAFVN